MLDFVKVTSGFKLKACYRPRSKVMNRNRASE